MSYERIEVTPLTPTIGAEISGVDLREPVDEPSLAEIRSALLEHKVIFFRDQDLTTEQHIEFARRFGELEIHPFVGHKKGHPEAMVIQHDENSRGMENVWHSDVTWRLEPSLGSVLRAVEVPDLGGDTLFADMYAAYEDLGDEMKNELAHGVAVHDFTHVFGRGLEKEELEEMQKEYPPAEHPVVRTHPETGRKGLYVNAAFTTHIKGMERAESDRLLRFLYERATVPEYQCRFRWRRNSIAFWDNRACQHYAASDYFPKVRRMVRVTVAGDKPV